MCSRLIAASLFLTGYASASLLEREASNDLPEQDSEDCSAFLQADIHTARVGQFSDTQDAANYLRYLLSRRKVQPPQSSPSGSLLLAPRGNDTISTKYWKDAERILNHAGISTPKPLPVNVPQPKPTLMPWEAVMRQPSQPLHTKIGAELMYELSGKVTPTPPPSQPEVDMQFVAQCPMVFFNQTLSIRAPSCNTTKGRWVDPSPLNVRDVLWWEPLAPSGIRLNLDSAVTGDAHFADITQELTLDTYKFVMTNCLDAERWHIEELVYKIDSMGHVSSTLDLHDVNQNSVAYFFKYLIKHPTGQVVAQSTLYRLGTKRMNFTEVKDGESTGKVLAVVDKQGQWTKAQWHDCMSPTSPRGWQITYEDHQDANALNTNHVTMATVADIRLAIAGVVTLMGHRDETRSSEGINSEGSTAQMGLLSAGIFLMVMLCIFCINCCQVFRGSGMRDKCKKVLFDCQGFLPRRPYQARSPELQATY